MGGWGSWFPYSTEEMGGGGGGGLCRVLSKLKENRASYQFEVNSGRRNENILHSILRIPQ